MTHVLSIGHSTLDYDQFAARLHAAGVTAIADVRTSPFSRSFAHFNRHALKEALACDGISYVFLGKELGGRPDKNEYYTDGIADYEKMATSELFRRGLQRIEEGARSYRIAMMCSERSPLDCHRCLLVGRALAQRGVNVTHILPDDETVTQSEIEEQLLAMAGMGHEDMFASRAERLSNAYRERSRKVAFAEAAPLSETAVAR
jgi:uncharacterized protein (DUF488 family)